jgi:hypothetical protein
MPASIVDVPYCVSLYYNKWGVFDVTADELKGDKTQLGPIIIFDTRIECERFVQGIIHAMQEMNAL